MLNFHIYCHIPYCKKRCKYCYFTAKYREEEMICIKNMDAYVNSLVKDITQTYIPEGRLQSIVFGGGTPSLLNKEQLNRIIEAIYRKLTEDTLKALKYMAYEVSPDTASYKVLQNFREAGFNRISIGVQSFDDNELRIMGRPYNRIKIKEVMSNIRTLNYDLVNIDLLIAIPGQTKESIISSVKEAIKLRPEHLSISLFYKSYPGGMEFVESCSEKGYKILGFEEKVEAYEEICNMIREAGYIRVDNTVFSLPGYVFEYEKDSISGTQSVLAFGPGSSGYWNGVIRYTPPEINKYIEIPRSICKEISVQTNAFATIWGQFNAYGYIDEKEIKKNFNFSTQQIIEQDEDVNRLITSLRQYDLIENSEKMYKIKETRIDKAIVIMHSIKDDWGYQLITAHADKENNNE